MPPPLLLPAAAAAAQPGHRPLQPHPRIPPAAPPDLPAWQPPAAAAADLWQQPLPHTAACARPSACHRSVAAWFAAPPGIGRRQRPPRMGHPAPAAWYRTAGNTSHEQPGEGLRSARAAAWHRLKCQRAWPPRNRLHAHAACTQGRLAHLLGEPRERLVNDGGRSRAHACHGGGPLHAWGQGVLERLLQT